MIKPELQGCRNCRWSVPQSPLASPSRARQCLRPARQPPRTLRASPVQPLGRLQTTARQRWRLVQPAAATSEDAEEQASEELDEDFALMQSVAQGLQIDPERPTYHVLAAEGGWINVSAALTTPPHVLAAPGGCTRTAAGVQYAVSESVYRIGLMHRRALCASPACCFASGQSTAR